MAGMPGGRPAGELGPHRYRQLGQHQHREADHAPAPRHPQPRDPAHLDGGDSCGVTQRAGTALGMLACRAQPLGDQRQPHDHVPDQDRGEVVVVEPGGYPGGEHQHPTHLHQRQQAVRHVVGVVGRGEPGEVHPRPPDAEKHHEVTHQCMSHLPFSEGMMQLGRCSGHCHHERQVEQQLQRGGGALTLAGIAADHSPQPRGGLRGQCHGGHFAHHAAGAGTLVGVSRPSPRHFPDAVRARRRLSSQARRGELLEAALREFSSRGYYLTQMEHVAATAGVSKALVYQHFPSKEELFAAVTERVVAGFTGQLPEVLGMAEDALGAWRGVVRLLCDLVSERPEAWALVARHLDNPELGAPLRQLREQVG
jgi:Bacterial regulatory proteins, tetR family